MSHAPEPKPWERMPWDSAVSWGMFQDYLALPPPRRLSALKGPIQGPDLDRVAREGLWAGRALEWDDHLARIRTTTIERVTEEDAAAVARRQLKLARTLQRLAQKELDGIEQIAEASGEYRPGMIPPKELVRYAAIGVRIEREVSGTVLPESTGPDLSGLSLEDLRTLAELQRKAGIR